MATYISCADTAKLIRKALKENFPGIKFSVKKTSGSSSVYVRWTDGPTRLAVEKIVKVFEGASFDGMYDLESVVTSELNGEQVHFGAKYVICERNLSARFFTAVLQQFCQRFGIAMPNIEGNEENAWIRYDALSQSDEHWFREILSCTDAKDMYRAYEAKEEAEARRRAEWEAGAPERARQAKAEQERHEKEQEVRREQEKRDQERRAREQAEQERRNRAYRQRDGLKEHQRFVLASQRAALSYFGLDYSANTDDIKKAFRKKVAEMADGKGGYTEDMDFLVKVKERALG